MPEIAGMYYRWHEGECRTTIPIILIHGAGLDSRLWSDFTPILNNPSIITVDLPGHGQSQATCLHTLSEYLEKFFQLLEALAFHRVILVGVGLGGSLAMEYAYRFTDRVVGWMAINSATQYHVPERSLELLQDFKYREAFKALVARGMPSYQQLPGREVIETIARAQRPSVLAADLRLLHQYQFSHPLSSISKVPGLLLYGMADRLLRSIPAQSIDQMEVRGVPARGHWLPQEDPQLLARLFSEYLSRVAGFMDNERLYEAQAKARGQPAPDD